MFLGLVLLGLERSLLGPELLLREGNWIRGGFLQREIVTNFFFFFLFFLQFILVYVCLFFFLIS